MTEPRHLRLTRRAALAWAAALAGAAHAQQAGNKPYRIIVAFGPGSFNDIAARELARFMGETLGHPMIVENRPGAGGSVGTEVVVKAPPDGATIGLGTSSQMVMNVALYRNLPFDVDKDLRLIGLVGRTPLLLAGKASGPKTLKELIAHARANPGQVSYGSGGTGSISHIVGEAFERAAGIKLTHVPYKGNGPALADLSGGHVDLVFDGLATSRPLAEQGRVHLLAISGAQRNPAAPDLPTFAEQGVRDYDAYSWNCLMAPAATPPEMIARLNQALNQALTQPAIKERFAQAGVDILGPSTPEQADAFGQRERARWVPFVRSLKLDVN